MWIDTTSMKQDALKKKNEQRNLLNMTWNLKNMVSVEGNIDTILQSK